ncbi:hypothetical protein MNB_SUP05-5-270 [hydrothermal vent metagenome]|uniref:Uncharacterized protein n=1 Tax=hydrothermal vent metagenome TaxID=652676 RepID=A0A1W1CIH7_9ZZZZ
MKLFLLNAPRYLSYYIAMLEKNNEKGILIMISDYYYIKEYLEILTELKKKQPFVENKVSSPKFKKNQKNF